MAVGDIEIVKIDEDHQLVKVTIETGEVEIKVKNGTSIFAEDGTPSISHDGMEIYTNDQGTVHRIDGPAVIDHKKGLEKYFINAKAFTKEEFFMQPEVLNHRKRQIDLDID